MSSNNRTTIDIAPSSIIMLLLVAFAVWLVFHVFDVLILIFLAMVLAAALSPLVTRLERWLPRWLGVLAILFGFIGTLSLSIYLLVPPVVGETKQLIEGFQSGRLRLDGTIFGYQINSQQIADQLKQNFDQVTGSFGTIVGAAGSVVSGLFGVFTVVILALYILLDEKHLKQMVTNLAPPGYRKHTIKVASEIGEKMGAWLRGQLALGVLVGVVSYIGLWLFDVKFALPLAIFAGVTELLPIIGPFLGAGAAIIVAATDDWTKALLIGGWYLVLQQIEAHILVPQVMKRALGLSPVVIVIALLIGAKLYGILGLVLSIPVAAALSVVINEWPELSRRRG